MFNKTPLATALALALSVPFAAPAFAQTAPSTPAQDTAQATPAGGSSNASPGASASAASTNGTNGTLPTIAVSGQTDQGDFQAERSTVGAKTPTALRDIPQTVTVINRAVLQSQGATSFQDALRNAPGVTIGAAEGGQIGNNVNLRGFTAQNDI